MRGLTFSLLITCFATGASAEYVPLGTINNVQTLSAPGLPAPALKPVLGQGYDVFSNELRQDCVAGNGHDYTDGHKGAALLDIEYINTTSDMQSYDKASQQSVSLSFAYKLFNAELGDEIHTSKTFNSVNQFARIYRRLVTQAETRNDGKWQPSIEKVVAQDLNKPNVMKKFTELCGTHFISGIYRGDLLDQTVKFNLNKDSYTEEGKKNFSAGLKGIFSAGYSDTASQNSLKTVSEFIFIKHGDQGAIGKSAPNPNSPGGPLAAAQYAHTTYADQVADLDPATSAIIGIEVLPYWRFNLEGRDAFGRWQDTALDNLKNKQPAYSRLLSALSDIDFALNEFNDDAKRRIFYDETSDSLRTKNSLATNIQNAFLDAVKVCYDLTFSGEQEKAAKACGDDLKKTLPTDQVQSVRPKLKQ